MMKVTDLKPLGARILVERGEAKKETASGILIPDNSTEKPQDGVVIAVGPEVKDLRPGARVLLPKYGGTTIEEEGVESEGATNSGRPASPEACPRRTTTRT